MATRECLGLDAFMLLQAPSMGNALDDAAECAVDRFEDAWNAGPPPSVRAFVPEGSEEGNLSLLCELIRVDMERRQTLDLLRDLEDYLQEFAGLRRSPMAISALAFEDYRQRLQSSERIAPEKYSSRFGVDTSTWPVPKTPEPRDTQALGGWNASTINILRTESQRLVDAIVPFPEIGTNFLGFELVEVLGEGAFSRVFLARQSELANREVVLKLSTELWSESQKLARLQHTNIVPVYSVHRLNSLQALCMPYWGRTTLEGALANSRAAAPVSNREREAKAVHLVARIGEGLAHAHRRGIVHRDLKPANILVTDDGEPMLLDFNLSEDVVVGGRSSLMVGGTLPYMAPEHLTAVLTGARVDKRCDLYSIGVLLFQLLTGELPFPVRSGNFAESIAWMVADRSRKTWRDVLPPSCSPDIRSILDRCLHPDPDFRYPDAEQLCEDLQRHAADMPLAHAVNRSWRQRGAKWVRRNRWIASTTVLLLGTLIVVTALTGLILGQRDRISRTAAIDQLRTTQADVEELRMGLGFQSAPADLREDLQQRAEQVLVRYGVRQDPLWRSRSRVVALPTPERHQLDALIQEILWRLDEEDTPGSPAARERSSSGGLRYSKAIAALRERDYGMAEAELQSWLATHRKDTAAWTLYGNALAGLQRYSEAEDALTRAAALAPTLYFPLFQRGVCRLERGDFRGAEADFTLVLRLKPGLVSAQFNRAQARAGQFRHDDAISDLNQILVRQPRHVRALLLRAKLNEGADRPEAAREDRATAFQSEPEDAQGWIDRGIARVDDAPRAALADFLAATKAVAPSNRVEAQAWQNVFHVAGDILKDYPTALAAVERWKELLPHDPMPVAGRAVIWARQGNQDAIQEIEKALALRRDPTTCYQAASCYAVLAKVDEQFAGQAIELLRESLRGDLAWFATAVSDPDFEGLRKNREFLKLLGAANRLNGRP